jgi:hypothetical protein
MWIFRIKRSKGTRRRRDTVPLPSATEVSIQLSRYEIECLLRPHSGDLGSYVEVPSVRDGTDRAIQKLHDALAVVPQDVPNASHRRAVAES